MKKVFLIIFIFLMILYLGYGYQKDRSEFSSEKWESDIWGREQMIEDLTRSYDLQNMNSEEILDLLGTNGMVFDSHYIYYIGKSFSGPVLFAISFDENDYVSSYGVIID